MRHWMVMIPVVMLASSACATRNDVRRAVADARAQTTAEIEAERQARMAGVTELRNEMQAELAAVRRDLESLRTDFSTRITGMEEGIRFIVPVHFAFDDAGVRPEDEQVLARFAEVVRRHYPTSAITVEGFADPAGSRAYNLRLSHRRAEAVRSHLTQLGIDGSMLRAVGYGKDRLVVPDAWGEQAGAEMNRRVVFVIESAELPPGFIAVAPEHRDTP
ncbi:MAG TPA: OmpA family protein [Gemmatimonadaceae bacterium]|nr:OmpA family protein [Gemmatimonadaceae bacterium]